MVIKKIAEEQDLCAGEGRDEPLPVWGDFRHRVVVVQSSPTRTHKFPPGPSYRYASALARDGGI
jgi:hypothetical protein